MDFKHRITMLLPRYFWQVFVFFIALMFSLTAAKTIMSSSNETQNDLETKVKAAYINNFTRFVYWKTNENGDTKNSIVIGVYGNDNIGDVLEEFSKKQSAAQSIIVKKFKKKMSEVSNCNLLFISQSEQQQLPQILKQLEGSNVLTVSDIPGFAKRGGMIGFFIDQNKIKIEINVKAANKAGLKISAKLLEVARIVESED